jgi:hypothetical protein
MVGLKIVKLLLTLLLVSSANCERDNDQRGLTLGNRPTNQSPKSQPLKLPAPHHQGKNGGADDSDKGTNDKESMEVPCNYYDDGDDHNDKTSRGLGVGKGDKTSKSNSPKKSKKDKKGEKLFSCYIKRMELGNSCCNMQNVRNLT